MTAGALKYRLAQEADHEGILHLWNENSDWGELTTEQFEDWYIKTPYGRCLLVVAVADEERIVGLEVFTPSEMVTGDEEKKAIRISAPILAKELRQGVISQANPTFEMFRLGMDTALQEGFEVLYGFPFASWLPFIKLMAGRMPNAGIFASGEFECYELSLNGEIHQNSALDNQVRVALTTEFSEDHMDLWKLARLQFPLKFAVKRSPKWLKWKLGGHKAFDVRRSDNNDLMGYTAIRENDGLVIDALARNADDLETVISAVHSKLGSCCETRSAISSDHIRMMKTEQVSSVIDNLGFQRIDFKFAFFFGAPTGTVPAEAMELENWYLMPND